ncbi:hypothetical protein WJX84_011985 [Apatococcus fuscideae]|uniref:Uncharacterized protein n=1 Tax=Apatococcus fuscideae TaxID=2026836 RepID=A0AAW1T622_9CHLO
MERSVQGLTAELERQRSHVERLCKERDVAKRTEQLQSAKIEGCQRRLKGLDAAEERARELQAQVFQERHALQDCRLALQQEQERAGKVATARELQGVISNLQEERKSAQVRLAKQSEQEQRVASAVSDAHAAEAKVKELELELARIRDKLVDKESGAVKMQHAEAKLKARTEDLRLFVEVLQEFCNDPRQEAEVRASEARLKHEVSTLQSQMASSQAARLQEEMDKQQKAAEMEADKMRKDMDRLRLHMSKLQDEAKESAKSAESARADSESFICEIDSIHTAYEDMMGQNMRLLQQLTERDEANNQLLSERIKGTQTAMKLAGERDAAVDTHRRTQEASQILQNSLAELERRLQGSIEEAAKLRDQVRGYAGRMEAMQWELKAAEDAKHDRDARLEAMTQTADEHKRALEEESGKLVQERAKRQRCEDDTQVLQSKLDKLKESRPGGQLGSEQQELETLRTMVRCSLCNGPTTRGDLRAVWSRLIAPVLPPSNASSTITATGQRPASDSSSTILQPPTPGPTQGTSSSASSNVNGSAAISPSLASAAGIDQPTADGPSRAPTPGSATQTPNTGVDDESTASPPNQSSATIEEAPGLPDSSGQSPAMAPTAASTGEIPTLAPSPTPFEVSQPLLGAPSAAASDSKVHALEAYAVSDREPALPYRIIRTPDTDEQASLLSPTAPGTEVVPPGANQPQTLQVISLEEDSAVETGTTSGQVQLSESNPSNPAMTQVSQADSSPEMPAEMSHDLESGGNDVQSEHGRPAWTLLPPDPEGMVAAKPAPQQKPKTWTIVTGGNRGLGLELCRKLLKAGKPVLLCSRSPENGRAAVAQLIKESGAHEDTCRSLHLDTSDRTSISQFVGAIKSGYDQQVEALVNNAAVMKYDWKKDSFDASYATNFEGPLQLTEKLVPHLKPGGTVVMVSSTLGSLSRLSPKYQTLVTEADSIKQLSKMPHIHDDPVKNIMVPPYSLTKAMMNRMTQLLAADPLLTSRQITINSVCPGWCRTDMGSEAAPRTAQQGAQSILDTLQAASGERPNGGFFKDGQALPF